MGLDITFYKMKKKEAHAYLQSFIELEKKEDELDFTDYMKFQVDLNERFPKEEIGYLRGNWNVFDFIRNNRNIIPQDDKSFISILDLNAMKGLAVSIAEDAFTEGGRDPDRDFIALKEIASIGEKIFNYEDDSLFDNDMNLKYLVLVSSSY